MNTEKFYTQIKEILENPPQSADNPGWENFIKRVKVKDKLFVKKPKYK